MNEITDNDNEFVPNVAGLVFIPCYAQRVETDTIDRRFVVVAIEKRGQDGPMAILIRDTSEGPRVGWVTYANSKQTKQIVAKRAAGRWIRSGMTVTLAEEGEPEEGFTRIGAWDLPTEAVDMLLVQWNEGPKKGWTIAPDAEMNKATASKSEAAEQRELLAEMNLDKAMVGVRDRRAAASATMTELLLAKLVESQQMSKDPKAEAKEAKAARKAAKAAKKAKKAKKEAKAARKAAKAEVPAKVPAIGTSELAALMEAMAEIRGAVAAQGAALEALKPAPRRRAAAVAPDAPKS
jgi:hypothetical protein